MTITAIIGGSGLYQLPLQSAKTMQIETPYGRVELQQGQWCNQPVLFLTRHGANHQIAPHEINYRANIWALHHLGAHSVIAVASVGGIRHPPGSLVIPNQIIDYTWGRAHTFNDQFDGVLHIDFTEPYCQSLRQELLGLDPQLIDGGTYGATQGPRLETAAEIKRMEQDGCTLVGMTGMPEASLARELGLCFAHLCLVVNWAAGKQTGPIDMEDMQQQLNRGIEKIIQLLAAYLQAQAAKSYPAEINNRP